MVWCDLKADLKWAAKNGRKEIGLLQEEVMSRDFLKKSTLLRYNFHTIKCIYCKLYSLMSFDKCIHLGNHHYNPDL